MGPSDGTVSELEHHVVKKVMWHILPLMVLMFFVSTLDRVNVAFAALQMNVALGLSPTVYGWGAGIFFIGYFLFEVPSNVILDKVGARMWMARIMVTWGIVSGGMAFVSGPTSFYVMRFLLGVAEAGFLPGMILYMGYWLPKRYLARALGLFTVGAPITTMLGSPLSSWLLGLDGAAHLAGWQWMFLIEGTPAVVLAVVWYLYTTDRPSRATWLTASEKAWLVQTLDAEQAAIERRGDKYTLWQALRNPRVLVMSAVYLFVVVGLYGVGFWIPQMVRRVGLSTLEVGFVAATPYFFASLACYFWGRHSDEKGERRWHMVSATAVAAAGLALSAAVNDPIVGVVALCIAAAGIYAFIPVFWSCPHNFLTGAAAAAGIALINSVGNLGGFAGPYLVGWLKQATGGFGVPLLVLSSSVLLGSLIVLLAMPDPDRPPRPQKTGPALPA